ncbi:MAG: serine/threonine-protein kinase [Myxococcota bacterium]
MYNPHLVTRGRSAAASNRDSVDDEARALLQRRTRVFALIMSAVSGGFLLYRVTGLLLSGSHDWSDETGSLLLHATGVCTAGVLWWLTRRPRAPRYLRRVDAGAYIAACAAYAGMAPTIPIWLSPEFIVLLAMTLTTFTRAAAIPSTGTRTASLGALAALPLLVGVGFSYATQFEPAPWTALAPVVAAASREALVAGKVLNTGVWWFGAVAVATATSRVLYELHRDMRHVRRLGRYELGERLGAGGMGEVYQAHHALLERPTAVKLLSADAPDGRSEQFEREVRLTAQLRHPNTVTIFDYGHTADGVFYYAMELIDGLTLDDLVEANGPLSPARAIHILRQAAGALVEAHGVGLIHRDIKPGNLMVSMPHLHGGVGEQTKVLDFGLARQVRAGGVEESRTDTLRGTPLYMAPETIRGDTPADGRTDLYALGAVAWFLVLGRPVFDGASIIEVCSQHLHEAPEAAALEEVGVPPALRTLILSCLAKSRDARPASALDVLEALEELARQHPWTADDARRWWRAHQARERDDELTTPRPPERAPVRHTIEVVPAE